MSDPENFFGLQNLHLDYNTVTIYIFDGVQNHNFIQCENYLLLQNLRFCKNDCFLYNWNIKIAVTYDALCQTGYEFIWQFCTAIFCLSWDLSWYMSLYHKTCYTSWNLCSKLSICASFRSLIQANLHPKANHTLNFPWPQLTFIKNS